ncbi:MAG: DUF2752 domain-containing protein [Armatimonadota bacterium]
MKPSSRNLIFILWFPIMILMMRYIPFDHLPSTCMFVNATGFPCPTCGMTRAMIAIGKGDWQRAYVMNTMSFPLTGFLGLVWVGLIYDSVIKKRMVFYNWLGRRLGWVIGIGFAIIMIFGAIRIYILANN